MKQHPSITMTLTGSHVEITSTGDIELPAFCDAVISSLIYQLIGNGFTADEIKSSLTEMINEATDVMVEKTKENPTGVLQ